MEEAMVQEEPERYELIDGVIYDMTVPPSTGHQRVSNRIYAIFANHLRGKTCEAFHAPFGVWFSEKDDEHVEPDVVVVCDPSKIQDKGCVGTPDLVVEVLSPVTAAKDRKVKLRRYQRAGVREYWIVDPTHKTVEVYRLEENVFGKPDVYSEDDTFHVGILDDLLMNLRDVFY
ncbi:MAG: Uma2 family endonuclease [Alicyclobacillus sp.]|nr:Uma2 family endonuclease [Alicyclobacillus sp.]MCL6517782.1 Uma2 family endonuclease [Alicyclobacillus sp.]